MNPLAIDHKYLVPLIISIAMFMESLDTTIINTAIPVMSHSLHVNPIDLKIALISYLLSLAIFIPISGWIADKFGIKKIFISALSLFVISSILCGFAHQLWQLVGMRMLQGMGGSLMMPLGRLIIARTFQRSELVNMMSRVIMVGALGVMLGPVFGGLIVHYVSWPWIFWVNVPVGIVAILLAQHYLPTSEPIAVPPLDKKGFVLFGGGLAGLTFSLSAFSESSMQKSMLSNLLFASLLLLAAYVWHAKKQTHPLIKTELFNFNTFRVSILGNLFARIGFGGMPFLVPLLLQISLHYSAQLSGLLLAPIALGIFFAKSVIARLLRKFGYKRLLILNTWLVGLSLWLFTLVTQTFPVYGVGLLTLLYGFLISLQYSCMNSLAYADTPPQLLSSATSLLSTVQQISQSMGVAISALLISLLATHTPDGFLLTLSVFHHTFFLLGILTFCSTFIFLLLRADDGHQMMKT